MSLNRLSALQVPGKELDHLRWPLLSLITWRWGSDKEWMALLEIPAQASGRKSSFFHLRTWKPKSCLFFFFFFLDRWDAKEGEDTSFLKDDPDSQVSSSVQGGLSSLLKTCTIRKVVSQYGEGRSLCYGVNVSLDSTLQVAGRESIDSVSITTPT